MYIKAEGYIEKEENYLLFTVIRNKNSYRETVKIQEKETGSNGFPLLPAVVIFDSTEYGARLTWTSWQLFWLPFQPYWLPSVLPYRLLLSQAFLPREFLPQALLRV